MEVAVVHRCVSLSRQEKVRRRTKQFVLRQSNKIEIALFHNVDLPSPRNDTHMSFPISWVDRSPLPIR
jgi:hypothetical protein